jgi:hypothetical protein
LEIIIKIQQKKLFQCYPYIKKEKKLPTIITKTKIFKPPNQKKEKRKKNSIKYLITPKTRSRQKLGEIKIIFQQCFVIFDFICCF